MCRRGTAPWDGASGSSWLRRARAIVLIHADTFLSGTQAEQVVEDASRLNRQGFHNSGKRNIQRFDPTPDHEAR